MITFFISACNVFSSIFADWLENRSQYYMGLVATKPVFRTSDKARLKPVSSATETS